MMILPPPEPEGEMLWRTGHPRVTEFADHRAWPVSCGHCGQRCLGAQIQWHRDDLRRAFAVTIFGCAQCRLWGLAWPQPAIASELELWKERCVRALHSSLAFGPSQFTSIEGRRLTEEPRNGAVDRIARRGAE